MWRVAIDSIAKKSYLTLRSEKKWKPNLQTTKDIGEVVRAHERSRHAKPRSATLGHATLVERSPSAHSHFRPLFSTFCLRKTSQRHASPV